MNRRQNIFCFVFCLVLFASLGFSQDFKQRTDGFFIVETAAKADEYYLSEVFRTVNKAKRDLQNDWGLFLSQDLILRIHPNISSFSSATAKPWYVAAIANPNKNKIDIQRLKVLVERRSLETTLRHELFHLAQPNDWPRWRAEGSAMLFSNEKPQAQIISQISEQELNDLLLNPSSQEALRTANATALSWVKELIKKEKTD